MGGRGVGRKVGRFEAGDRDCLYAASHLEEEGMGKLAQSLVRAGIGRREGMVAGRGSRKTKGVVMRGRGMSDAGGGGGRGI